MFKKQRNHFFSIDRGCVSHDASSVLLIPPSYNRLFPQQLNQSETSHISLKCQTAIRYSFSKTFPAPVTPHFRIPHALYTGFLLPVKSFDKAPLSSQAIRARQQKHQTVSNRKDSIKSSCFLKFYTYFCHISDCFTTQSKTNAP